MDDFEIIEKYSKWYKEPLVIAFSKDVRNARRFYFTSKLRSELKIKGGRDRIVFSVNNESIYFAIEGNIDSGGNSFAMSKSCGLVTMPTNLSDKISNGIYTVNTTPVFSKGLDWYELEYKEGLEFKEELKK